jgi:hypothetical protein
MYGGLFGDLPAAKKGGTSTSTSSAQGINKEERKDLSQNDNVNRKEDDQSNNLSSNWLAPVGRKKIKTNDNESSTIKTQQQQQSSGNSNSILQTVGRAGTSMAFVPTAALKRKKPTTSYNRFTKPLETPKDVAVPLSTTESSDVVAKDERLASPERNPQSENSNIEAADASFLQHEMTVTTTTVVRSSFKQPSQTSQVVNIHGDTNFSNPQHEHNLDTTQQQLQHHHMSQHFQHLEEGDVVDNEEITDPYDPYFPNDLLQYWERQAATEERARLEQEAKEALERQRLLREELNREQEHQPISGSVLTGVVGGDHTLLSSHVIMSGMGRGRGRGGVSNLPAWLVEKQRQEAEAAATLGNDAAVADTATAVDEDEASYNV